MAGTDSRSNSTRTDRSVRNGDASVFRHLEDGKAILPLLTSPKSSVLSIGEALKHMVKHGTPPQPWEIDHLTKLLSHIEYRLSKDSKTLTQTLVGSPPGVYHRHKRLAKAARATAS